MTSTLTTKQQYWSSQVKKAEQFDGSIADYARQNNISPQALYRWRHIVQKNTRTTPANDVVFTQAMILPAEPAIKLTVHVGAGELSFNQLPDPSWLSELLKVRTMS